jgi:hypothetical protein
MSTVHGYALGQGPLFDSEVRTLVAEESATQIYQIGAA